RRRAPDGDSAALPAEGDRRPRRARQERPALPDPSLWHPVRCRRRSRRLLRRQGDEQESVVAGTALARRRGRRWTMPEKRTLERARRDRREGKSPTTQAGEFVREEIHHVREGKHGARSAKQAIAIGLSKARRAGVPLPPPSRGTKARARTRTSAARDYAVGQGTRKPRAPSRTRGRATERALRREGHAAASSSALASQARTSAARRGARNRSAAAGRAARTKGPKVRRAAARKAAATRRRRR